MFDTLSRRDLVFWLLFSLNKTAKYEKKFLQKLKWLNCFEANNIEASACNFTKINTPAWVFLTFFKLYKWHQIAQRITFKNPLTFHLKLPLTIGFIFSSQTIECKNIRWPMNSNNEKVYKTTKTKPQNQTIRIR